MTDWIKVTGSTEKPYNKRRHQKWNQEYIWFPGDSSSVRTGDRLFLYTGHPLRRFYGVSIVSEEPTITIEASRGLKLRCGVSTHFILVDLDTYAVKAEDVFPLPSGIELVSLRQKSHLKIQPEDAARLSTHLICALVRESAGLTSTPVQTSFFNK